MTEPNVIYEEYLEKKESPSPIKKIKPSYIIWLGIFNIAMYYIINVTIASSTSKTNFYIVLVVVNILIFWALSQSREKHEPRDIEEALSLGYQQLLRIQQNADKTPVSLRLPNGKIEPTGTATPFPLDNPFEWRLGFKITDLESQKAVFYLIKVGWWKDDVAIRGIQELIQPYNAEEPYIQTVYAPVEKIPALERFERLHQP